MVSSLTVLLLGLTAGGAGDDVAPLQGKWKVAAVFEDGQSLTEKDIAAQLFADGTVTIDGPVISFLAPGAFEPRKLAFTLDARTEPKSIDLVGASRAGGKGIYLASGDSLMLCLPGPKEDGRPRDFGASKGSGRILIVFKRAPAKESAAAPRPEAPRPAPQPPAAPKGADEMRKALVGTWGHQTEESVNYYTLNADGSFSAIIEWKKTLKKTFSESVRASGSWKVENGVIIATVKTATDANLRDQVLSWRVTNLGPTALIAIDGQGRWRHEWRVR
jgi:uncharacterized protein (TIGR03067 family)